MRWALLLAVAFGAIGCSPVSPLTLVASCGPPSVALAETEPASPPEGPLALWLNVPAYRLDVLHEGRRTRSYKVAVGTPDHPTPRGDFRIPRVTWNPWWFPPPFEWAKDEKVTPPGPTNPTGRVKLFFGTYLFLHGTPAESTLGHAASHGCVRMANVDAIELARLVQGVATPHVPSAEIDSLVANPKVTRTYLLDRPVPLTIEYRLAELQDGRLLLHPDVYREDPLEAQAIVELLQEEGYPPGSLDLTRLDPLIERAVREHVRVRVADLLAVRVGSN